MSDISTGFVAGMVVSLVLSAALPIIPQKLRKLMNMKAEAQEQQKQEENGQEESTVNP